MKIRKTLVVAGLALAVGAIGIVAHDLGPDTSVRAADGGITATDDWEAPVPAMRDDPHGAFDNADVALMDAPRDPQSGLPSGQRR